MKTLFLLLVLQAMLTESAFAQSALVTRSDTVWFVNRSPETPTDTTRSAIAYVTSRNVWVQRRVPASWTELEPWEPADPNDTTVKAVFKSGHRLIHVADTIVQMADHFPARVYAVRDARSGRDTRVLNHQKPSLPYGDYGTEISAHHDDGDVVWFGMWAGLPSVDDVTEFRQRAVPEWIGGMLRYDVATGSMTPVLHPLLQTSLVRSIQRSGDALWLALVPADVIRGTDSTAALLRYDPQTRSWNGYRSDTSPFPGSVVNEMVAAGDLLLMATDSGAAVLNTRTSEWSVRWFDQIVRNDSVIGIFTLTRPEGDKIRDAAIAAANLLHEPRIGALLVAARRAPRDSLVAFLDCLSQCDDAFDLSPAITASAGLAHPVFIPFLRDALSRDTTDHIGNPWWIAIQALVRIGDSTSVELLRAQLGAPSTARAAAAASELAMIRDPVGRAWVLERLTEPASLSAADLETLVDAARESSDSTTVPALVAIALSRMDTTAMGAALDLSTPAQQRELARSIEGKAALWYGFLDRFTERRWAGGPPPDMRLMEDPEIRSTVLRIARTTLLRADTALVRSGVPSDWQLGGLHTNALTILSHWGTRTDVVLLARLFNDPQVNTYELAYALVRLTGVDAAPRIDRYDATAAERAASAEFWNSWWEKNGKTFTPPDLADRAHALTRWLTRHNLPLCC